MFGRQTPKNASNVKFSGNMASERNVECFKGSSRKNTALKYSSLKKAVLRLQQTNKVKSFYGLSDVANSLSIANKRCY